MRALGPVLSALALVAFTSTPVAGANGAPPAANLASPSPTPGPERFPMPSGCGIDVRMTLEETLGRDVDDAPSLRFVVQVRRMDASRVRASIAATSDPTRDRRIADATRAACTGGPASTVAGRAFVLAATGKSYDLSGADSDRFLALLVRTASAVAARDRLPPGDLDATLAPLGFGARDLGLAEGSATASPAAAPPCAKPFDAARVIDKVDPVYPVLARAKRESGLVGVAVRLDDHGLVRDVRLYDLGGLPADTTLIGSTLVAADRSTYAPERHDCVPTSKTYLFLANYNTEQQRR